MHSVCSNTTGHDINEKPNYTFLDLDIPDLIKQVERKEVDNSNNIVKIYWKVNFDRLTQDLRYKWLI